MKIFTGNPGNRKLNDKEPKPDSGIPDPPKCLCKIALQEWKNISQQLHAMGILTKVDRVALAVYCQTFAQWYDAEEHINKNGTTINVDGPFRINPNGPMPTWQITISVLLLQNRADLGHAVMTSKTKILHARVDLPTLLARKS